MSYFNPNSAVFYHGPSLLDSDIWVYGIVSAIKRPSGNGKTGHMLQTWILRDDIHPAEAHYSGNNKAACGNCPFSGTACYVNWVYAPSEVWKSMKNGNIRSLADQKLPPVPVRIGSAGDPLAIPFEAWKPLFEHADKYGFTGYTHQWRKGLVSRWKNMLWRVWKILRA